MFNFKFLDAANMELHATHIIFEETLYVEQTSRDVIRYIIQLIELNH